MKLNYKMPNLNAALGLSQIVKLKKIKNLKKEFMKTICQFLKILKFFLF